MNRNRRGMMEQYESKEEGRTNEEERKKNNGDWVRFGVFNP
jgi:hypothetical protein